MFDEHKNHLRGRLMPFCTSVGISDHCPTGSLILVEQHAQVSHLLSGLSMGPV